MRKPNAIWHMLKWGGILGACLGILFATAVMFFFIVANDAPILDNGLRELIFALIYPIFYGGFFGIVPGLILGCLDGLVLWYLLRDIQPPVNPMDIQARRPLIYSAMTVITFLGAVALWGFAFNTFTDFFILVPAVIANFAAWYAARRYLTKLIALDEKAKHKAKND